MTKTSEKFGQLLSQAIRQIAVQDQSKIHIVQDELGYALGRDTGGSAIEYWRKGYIPARIADIEMLAQELVRRGGLTETSELEQFLQYAYHPDPPTLVVKLQAGSPQSFSASSLFSDNAIAQRASFSDEHPDFVVGPPIIHPRYFFGRQRELKRLFNLLKHRPLQNAVIIGPRRSGKTSLLHYLQKITLTPAAQLRPGQYYDWLSHPETYRWLLVDFQDSRLGNQSGLLRYILKGLNLPIPEPCNLDRFMDVMGQRLRTPTVILLDEIDVALQRYLELDDPFWEGLRALATNQVEGNLGFVLASQGRPDQLAQQNAMGSPFFNIFGYTALLQPLQDEEARALIASSPIPFPSEDIAWILTQSGRWPILLQLLCRERLLTLEEGASDAAWREEALQQMVPFRERLA